MESEVASLQDEDLTFPIDLIQKLHNLLQDALISAGVEQKIFSKQVHTVLLIQNRSETMAANFILETFTWTRSQKLE